MAKQQRLANSDTPVVVDGALDPLMSCVFRTNNDVDRCVAEGPESVDLVPLLSRTHILPSYRAVFAFLW